MSSSSSSTLRNDPRETVLITGCSSGIGEALAKQFNSQGYRVFATARSTTSLTTLSALGIETFPLEVQSSESITALARSISHATNGEGLDYLINNAGRNCTVPALDLDIDDVRDLFETNVFAVMRICQVFAEMVVKRRGAIVMVGSLAGVMPYPFGSAYNASKGALHSYAETLRVELAPFSVRVITVVTGGVQSNIARVSRSLPPTSLYLPIADAYAKRLTHSQSSGSMPAEEYARSVVRQVTQKGVLSGVLGGIFDVKTRYVWEGNKAWVIRFLRPWFPEWAMDYLFSSMFSLSKLKNIRNQVGTKTKAA